MKDLTLIIPAFNEEHSLSIFLPKVFQFCLQNEAKVIIVNDGSLDKTKDILNECAGKYKFTKIIHHKVNKGYGASIKSGINASETKYIISLDADGQHFLEDIFDLYKCIKSEDADMIIGSRKDQPSFSRYRDFGKWIIRIITGLLIKTNIHDLNSGIKLMESELAKKYSILCPDDMSYSNIIVLIFISQRHKVIERPIKITKRIGGVSTISSRTAFDTVLEIINIIMFFNPMKIFGSISLVLLFSGFIWGVPIALQGKGISVGSMMLIVIGVIFFILGLLAEQISLIRKSVLFLNRDKNSFTSEL